MYGKNRKDLLMKMKTQFYQICVSESASFQGVNADCHCKISAHAFQIKYCFP